MFNCINTLDKIVFRQNLTSSCLNFGLILAAFKVLLTCHVIVPPHPCTCLDPHSCKAWADYWLITLINTIFIFMAHNDPFSWTLKWLLEPHEWSYNEDSKLRRTIMEWPLSDIPQSRPLLLMLRHFELKSDNLSFCNVKCPWSFY